MQHDDILWHVRIDLDTYITIYKVKVMNFKGKQTKVEYVEKFFDNSNMYSLVGVEQQVMNAHLFKTLNNISYDKHMMVECVLKSKQVAT